MFVPWGFLITGLDQQALQQNFVAPAITVLITMMATPTADFSSRLYTRFSRAD